MLSNLLRFVPDFILDPIYDAIFAEFVRRGKIILEEGGWNNDNQN